jgi:hypothetical protein
LDVNTFSEGLHCKPVVSYVHVGGRRQAHCYKEGLSTVWRYKLLKGHQKCVVYVCQKEILAYDKGTGANAMSRGSGRVEES